MKFLVLLCLISIVEVKELPSGFEKCHQSDPKINSCLNIAIQNSLKILKLGIPSFNIPPIEPLKFDYIADDSSPSSTMSLNSVFKNAELQGLADSKIHKTTTRFKNKFGLKSESFTKKLDFVGQYSMTGQILILPIRGEGFMNISLNELTTKHELTGDFYKGSDGQSYINITNYRVKLLPKLVIFRFDNLFNGDKTLGTTMNNLLNDNWEIVFESLIPGYEKNFGDKFKEIANRLFSQVPFELIFPK
ncbi:hypothetical protein PVAND_013069 [Polypedilum vanderplanki]|uniref:Uncharacterized protein n=1 Tax=Polypedilum vanderplanki TaxID=319348 RepID=A0A9J6CP96_POLVA|nr:hypothetical protein PVAND_013069 [Polypedilum vanderplanki]